MKNIPELIKEAHENAVERGVYDREECGDCEFLVPHGHIEVLPGWICEKGKLPAYHGKPDCDWRKSSNIKKIVYDKLEEELQEFANSTPSETFDKDSEQSEISDIILVLLAYAGEMGYDLEKDIIEKIAYNKERVY